MTDKTEAQPEALRLANSITASGQFTPLLTLDSAAAELRRQHAEIQQLKAELSDTNQMNEQLREQNTLVDAACATLEAQLSRAQAVQDGWRLVPVLPTLNMLNTAFGICTENGRPVQQMIEVAAEKYAAMIAASPTPPARKGLSGARKDALALYKPPFQLRHGYIFDSAGHMVADEGRTDEVEALVAARVRGWGRIGYMPNAAALQDEVGEVIVDALNQYWSAHGIQGEGNE